MSKSIAYVIIGHDRKYNRISMDDNDNDNDNEFYFQFTYIYSCNNNNDNFGTWYVL